MKFLTEAQTKFVLKMQRNIVVGYPTLFEEVEQLLEIIRLQNLALEKALLQRDDAIWNRFKLNPVYAEVFFANELADKMDSEIIAIMMNGDVK